MAGRGRDDGAWKPAVTPTQPNNRAARAFSMVLEPWDARPREKSCWREDRLQRQRLIGPALSGCAFWRRIRAKSPRFYAYLAGFFDLFGIEGEGTIEHALHSPSLAVSVPVDLRVSCAAPPRRCRAAGRHGTSLAPPAPRVRASTRLSGAAKGRRRSFQASGCNTLASFAACSSIGLLASIEACANPEHSARGCGRIHPSSAPLEGAPD